MEAAAVLIVLADAQDAQLVLTVTGVLMDAEVAVKVDVVTLAVDVQDVQVVADQVVPEDV